MQPVGLVGFLVGVVVDVLAIPHPLYVLVLHELVEVEVPSGCAKLVLVVLHRFVVAQSSQPLHVVGVGDRIHA